MGKEEETPVYLEYLPHQDLHRMESVNQHLKGLWAKKQLLNMENTWLDSNGLVTLVTVRLWDVADIIDLQGIHRDLFGAIIDEFKLPAFV